jgi:LytS/YehU family sensor histidine kinase
VSYSITFAISAGIIATSRIVGRARLQRLAPRARFGMYGIVSMFTAALGWGIGMTLIGQDFFGMMRRHPENLGLFALICVVATTFQGFYFFKELDRLRAERRAAEAQLRLLQGQIEPHFLFNTLANVLSLMDADTVAARRMLETFIDYLRASLTPIRNESCTLGAEIELVQAYLQLLQMRMGDRLRFRIDAPPDTLGVRIPPLLLQPLVENAIHHGLEPKIEGGEVVVRARVEEDRLQIEVEDDGLGLDAPPRRHRRGAGVALVNLRERLQVRYGDAASLELQPRHPGTCACLRLPLMKSETA